MGFSRLIRRVRGALATLPLLGLCIAAPAAARDIPAVAAASDLQFALTEVAGQFTRDTGKAVKLSFGSSGNFHRQIKEGGPFEMYLSADEGYVLDLARGGLTVDEGALYAVGRIVIIVPPNSPLKADGSLKDLAAALDAGTVRKFAIANPEHAPYGRAARDAMKTAGLWDRIADKLVLGENVSQAAQFATTGSTAGGIIAYSLALSPKVSALGQYALIPAEWHDPLRQRMVLTRKAGDTARAFYAYVNSAAARAVFRKYGFVLPGEM
ncbi:molybdate ABC transporter substrate-binding protein [Magnetospirillum sp. SS-4]|uniref:molybdate ABC transporter substrate-binding protein n=1 Tax=Magnetospirillum sp. SS-4 TaxID=2681465 RepID=UPI00138216B5|nr:molybdate ABC transporter substrate-binding protein [Magnetospirillum sp. SS-4]CAA7619926.1 Molybdate ABC transporter substrate-binding protein [Magnetospirillum sp. SS-4]